MLKSGYLLLCLSIKTVNTLKRIAMLKKLIILPAFMLLLTTGAFADPCNPDDADFNPSLCDGPGSGTGSTDVPSGVPLDGGASILLASGAVFGIKKLRANRKK